MMARIAMSRLDDFPNTGKLLIQWLIKGSEKIKNIINKEKFKIMIKQKRLSDAAIFHSSLVKWEKSGQVAAAYSLLRAPVPIQTALDDGAIWSLVKQAPHYDLLGPMQTSREICDGLCGRPNLEGRPYLFPVKSGMVHAVTKVNVRFGELRAGVRKYRPDILRWFEAYCAPLAGSYNDVASGALLAAVGLGTHYKEIGVKAAIVLACDHTFAKELTLIIKALGLVQCQLGAMLAEGQCLAGRYEGRMDIVKACIPRCNGQAKKNTAQVPDDRLRAAVRMILQKELPQSIDFDDPDTFWNKRWLWCVNGGHSRMAEHRRWLPKIQTRGRVHRKVVAENLSDRQNVLKTWNGYSCVSASIKAEPGKLEGRLLLADDTNSYMAFQHLLGPVEKSWRNIQTVMNPGEGGHYHMTQRVKALTRDGGMYYMLDYDDFNSQHTLRAHEIVTEELVRHCSYDAVLGARLINSFRRRSLYADGKYIGRIDSTLTSGHRGTMFYNSILNTAYIICAFGDEWLNVPSLHTGDDVICALNSYDDVAALIDGLASLKCRLKPIKQSLGQLGGEFLRVATNRHASRGYLLRAVGAFVAGNWVTDIHLEGKDAMSTIVASARTLINRSHGVRDMGGVLAICAIRLLGRKYKGMAALLRGEIALGDGPLYSQGFAGRHELHATDFMLDDHQNTPWADEPTFATLAYLRDCTSETERQAMQLSQVNVKNAMVSSSYEKTLGTRKIPNYMGVTCKYDGFKGQVANLDWLSKRRTDNGVLSKYPLLPFMKRTLSVRSLQIILNTLGLVVPIWKTTKDYAWGQRGKININGYLSYADAQSLGGKCPTTSTYTVPVLVPHYI